MSKWERDVLLILLPPMVVGVQLEMMLAGVIGWRVVVCVGCGMARAQMTRRV